MSLFFESIRVQNKQWCNIKYHNLRMNLTRHEIYGCEDIIRIEDLVKLPEKLGDEIYKCRITYAQEIHKVEFDTYVGRDVNSLRLVFDNKIEYGLKSTDRSKIQELYDQRQGADDIIIVKNGYITDTSYCSLVFYDGSSWVVPSTPLLLGTQRLYLLDQQLVEEREIRVDDLPKYKTFKMVNAMNPFETAKEIPVTNILP